MAHFTLVTLGRCAVEAADGTVLDLPAGKPFAILVYLATERRPVRREELAGLFWSDFPRQRAMQSVRQALWTLRQRVGDGCVRGTDPIEVDPTMIETDAWRMTIRVAEGRLDDAAALWGGAWLNGLELTDCKAWDEWADRQRLRIDTLLADALHSAATDGPTDRAQARLQLAVRIEPHNPRHAIALAEVHLDRQRPEAASRLLVELRQQEIVDVQSETVSALERRARDALRAKSAVANAFLMRPPFADRVGELAEMARLWRRTKDGATSRVLVRGPTGVGRSRLCEELAAMVRSDRCRVVRAVATKSDASLDLGVVASLARELLGLSGARGVTVASDSVLRSLLPSLSAAPAESGPHPAAYADALMDLVSAVAYEGPLLIVFEDTQWLDAASRSVLVRLARQVDREPVMFVATVSTDDPVSESERGFEELRRHTAVEVITLRGLDRAATVEWVSATLDSPAAEALASFAARLHAATSGNPGRAVECLGALVEAGAIRQVGARWRLLPERLPTVLPVPALPSSRRERGKRRTLVAVIALLFVAALTALVVQGALADASPPWGGGELWWLQGDSAVVLVPVDRNSEWLVREAPIDIPAGTSTFGPSITVSGARHYYMQHWGIPGTPWLSRLLPEGTEEVVARGDTDINSADLSPDGRRLVYTRDDPATEAYDIGVVLARPDGSEPRTIIQMPGKIAVDGWSRDGSSLLVMKMGSSDTIFVFSPTGKRLHELAAHPVSVATWCGPDHVLFRTDWRTEEPLRLWNPSTGQVRALDFHPLPAPSVCSPDGTAIAAWLAEGATTKLVVYDIRSSETLPVLDSSMPVSGLVWAARPGPVVDRVEIVGRRTVLAWGSSDSLGARVFDSEGRLRDDRVTWSSTDHHVASIDERGVLSANAPGVVSIVATAGVWRSDTLDVRVTSDSVANLLHSDPLASIDTTLWQIYGGPASPTIVQGEDGPVLSLPGDGVHRDGLISRHGLDMSHGATLEIAMRLKVDRTDRQQYSIYMFKPRSHIAGELDLISLDGYLAATWPADELHRFDSESLQVHVGNVPFKGGLPGSFDPDGWNRLALQVRVDGQVSAWVNGELVVLPPLHADLTDGRPWHIAIVGAAVDTDLHARDLIVWRGNRYTTPQN